MWNYNHIVNQAFIDEISKRFIVSRQRELQSPEARLDTERTNIDTLQENASSKSPILTNMR